MNANDQPPGTHIDFDAPCELRKWPSLNNQRRCDSVPYLVLASTLQECIREFMAKPSCTRHLYEIHTSPQPPLIIAILSAQISRSTRRRRSSEWLNPANLIQVRGSVC